MLCTGLLLALVAITCPMAVDAVNAPVGFGAGTTGGQGGTTVTPTTIAQLRTYLCGSTDSRGHCTDSTRRVILINRTFDFRNSLGKKTETGCKVKACPNGQSDLGLNWSGFCNGRTATSVTYDLAGVNDRLVIGSNKSIIGVKNTGVIKGTGLRIFGGVSNIIVQNVQITDINEGIVWGGDAISIDGASKIWIDHNYIARVGRQMIVTGFGSATDVTISHNVFDGSTRVGAYCDGRHYWLWLFLGKSDTITLYGNIIQNTSGRGPHSGGMNSADVRLHMVNNHFRNVGGEGALMSLSKTSYILAEGNYFQNVAHPVYKYRTEPGPVFTPFDGNAAKTCSTYLKRSCVANSQTQSSSKWNYSPADIIVLKKLSTYSSSLINPAAANTVPGTTARNAGVGKVN
ncbi:probable pectin lyase F [Cephus cinctus]|uniref:pectin lyase n=1 Tax=Cephus cinctus TaxID=211228 RepID=A0AAJ7BKB4_CEPCN|nr:probable pectin lyase F [Cephus cinctus]